MKQHIFNTLATALVAVLVLAGCKKEDVTAPVITLNGSNPMNVDMGSTFTDPGATATDEVDGDLTSQITATGTVNVDSPGVYARTYTVSDAAGNAASAQRMVNVNLTRDGVLGAYQTSNNCPAFPYNTVATTTSFQAGSTDSKFVINSFYYNGGTLICTLSGFSVTVDAGQSPNPIGDGVTGTGTFSSNGKVLVMNYTFQPNGGSPTNCSVTYTRN